jgi:hypothetical protein
MTHLRGTFRTEPGHRLHFYLNQIHIYLEMVAISIVVTRKITRPQSFLLGSPLLGVQVEFPLPEFGSVAYATEGSIPETIEMRISDNALDKYDETQAAKGLKRRQSEGFIGIVFFFSGTFVMFWDSYSEAIQAACGNDAYKWPSILNFARVIRNACSHGGKIHFKNMNAAPVQWHSCSLSPADHGKLIIGEDFNPTTLLILMWEISEELDRLGIPVA